jgi:hypothetical protein
VILVRQGVRDHSLVIRRNLDDTMSIYKQPIEPLARRERITGKELWCFIYVLLYD